MGTNAAQNLQTIFNNNETINNSGNIMIVGTLVNRKLNRHRLHLFVKPDHGWLTIYSILKSSVGPMEHST